jgi:hypothetical protein
MGAIDATSVSECSFRCWCGGHEVILGRPGLQIVLCPSRPPFLKRYPFPAGCTCSAEQRRAYWPSRWLQVRFFASWCVARIYERGIGHKRLHHCEGCHPGYEKTRGERWVDALIDVIVPPTELGR